MKLTDFIGRQAREHPLVIIVVISVITIALLIPLFGLRLSTDIANFEPDSETVRANRIVEKGFTGATSYTSIMTEAKDGNIFDKDFLVAIDKMEEGIRKDKKVKKHLVPNPSKGVVSLVSPLKATLRMMRTTLAKANQDQANKAVITVLSSNQGEQLKSLISDDLNLKDGPKAEALMTQVGVDKTMNEKNLKDVELRIADIAGKSKLDQIKTYSLSSSVFHKAIDDGAKESQPLFAVSLILVILILVITFRDAGDVVLCLLTLPMAFIIAFGLSSLLEVTTSIASFFAPILILGLGIDYGIHILLRYREERYKGESPDEATYMSAHFVGMALVLTTITTVAAFFSNAISELPGIRGFGIMVGLGIISAYVVMAIFLPSLKLLLDRFLIRHHWKKKKVAPKVSLSTKKVSDFLGTFTKDSIKHPYIVLILTVLATGAAIYGASKVESKFAVREMTPKDSVANKAVDFQNDKFSSSKGTASSILVEGDVTEPKVINAMFETVQRVANDKQVVKVKGKARVSHIGIYLKALTEASRFDPRLRALKLVDANKDGLPDTEDGIKRAYDYLYRNGLGKEVTSREIKGLIHKDSEGNYDRAQIRVYSKSALEPGVIKKVYKELVRDKKPLNELEGIKATITGELVVGDQIADRITTTMLKSILISLIVTALVLVIVFASFKYGLTTLIPVSLVALWTVGTMYWLKYDLNVLTVSNAAIAIGLGVDYSIHVTQRYREELAKQKNVSAALTTAVAHTGAALLGAAATTIVAFATLGFSTMDIFHRFGVMGSIMMAYSFVAAVAVLPVLLSLVERRKSKAK